MMSETFAANRVVSGSDEFDRRRRAMAPAAPPMDDPLAELARLVGQDDPFRGLSPQGRPAATRPAPARPPVPTDFAAFDDVFAGAPDVGEEPGAPDDPAVVHAPADHRPLPPRLPAVSVRGERGPELSSDAWARGGEPLAAPPGSILTATREAPVPAAETGGSSRRTLIVLAAVMALTGGGLAASFLAKPTGSMAAVSATGPSTSAPTILAATGPTKVQPETPATDPDAPSEPSTLLDKNKNDGTATAKVVNTVEQPVDLGQTVKPQASSATDDAASQSPFPEPRKVKTIIVRPDGTMIANSAPQAADTPLPTTATQQASLAFDPQTSLPIVANPSAAAAVPADQPPVGASPPATTPAVKSQARVGTTPKPAATPSHTVATDGRVTGTTPKPKAAVAAAKPAGETKPVRVADATPPAADNAAVSPVTSGKFGVQLGAAGSDAEARDLASRLSKKFAGDFGGARPGVRKAEVGDKTVYRVRVGGLSQDSAKALCGKVSAGGGGCFVVRD